MKSAKQKIKVLFLAAAVSAGLLLAFLFTAGACCSSRAAEPQWGFTPTVDIFLALVLDRPAIGDAGRLLITEVLYDPDESQGEVEWVEILNPTGEVVDLDTYKIGDEEALGGSEGMYIFPPGARIGVGETVVIAKSAVEFAAAFGFEPDFEFSNTGAGVPIMLKYTAWAGGSLTLTNPGDEILLLDVFDDLVDSVSWGNSNWAFDPDVPTVPKGHSLERLPGYVDTDTAADWGDQPAPSPGQVDLSPPEPTPTVGPSPTPFMGGLLISEVLYDPDGPESEAEWFEVQNTTGAPIDISGFKVGDEEIDGGSEGMYVFPEGSVLAAGDAIVVANQAFQFEVDYGWKPDYELSDTDPEVPDLAKYTAWSGGSISLSNAGDELLLIDPFDNLVDAVSWAASAWAFDPPVQDVSGGHSIERFPFGADTDTAADWRDQGSPTPGAVP